MKRRVIVKASGSAVRVSIDAKINSRNDALSQSEILKLRNELADKLSDTLRELPYTHFSVTDISVK